MIVTNDCKNCGNDIVRKALCEIDHELAKMGGIKYNNEAYYLNDKFNVEKWESLVLYKSILQRKLYDCNYTDYSVQQIISKVKSYIYGR